MPATERSLRLTDAYRDHLLQLRRHLVATAGQRWGRVNLEDLEATYRAWALFAAAALTAGQRAGARATDTYFSAYMEAELGRPAAIAAVDGDELVGRGRDGRGLAEVLAPPLITVRQALKQGTSVNRALQMGQARATRILAVELTATPRVVLDRKIAGTARVVGWRRVASANACGACLGAATGAIHESAIPLRVHGFCRCIKEAVVAGVDERHPRPTARETWASMTKREQNALFAGRGGADKAELIRSGRVDLEDLVHHQPMATVADEITEAPLALLRAKT
jgi:hypothetical protein